MIFEEVSNKVKEIRARHSVTQEELADFLRMAPATFRKKESGAVEFKASEMFLIIYYFNTYHHDTLKLEEVFLHKFKQKIEG